MCTPTRLYDIQLNEMIEMVRYHQFKIADDDTIQNSNIVWDPSAECGIYQYSGPSL